MSVFFFSSRRRHTRFKCDWSSDVCSSDLRNTHGLKNADERTLAEPDLLPRDNTNDKCEPSNIEQHQHYECPAQCLWNRHLWIRRFAGRASDNFDPEKTEKPQNDTQADAFPPIRKKTAVCRVVCEADFRK